jgi:hypothetical protein
MKLNIGVAPPSVDGHILTRQGAAAFVHIKLRTLDHWRLRLGLPWHKVGHRVFITRKELIKFVESHISTCPGHGGKLN